MRSGTLVVTGMLAIGSLVLACGASKLPAPSYTSHPTSALVEVPYPPPPARVEWVPPRPKGDVVVWIDGEWTWRGRRWAWRAGRWVVPPANASFAPWTSVRDGLGSFHVAQGVWRDPQGNEVAAPKALALGMPSAGPITNPEGEEEPAAPSIVRDGSQRQPSRGDAAIDDEPTSTMSGDAGGAIDLDAGSADSGRMPQP